MSRSVHITGGITAVGAIEVYGMDGVTPMTSFDFPNFTGGEEWEMLYCYFFINNTGNLPVYVYWNISDSSISWIANADGYTHQENKVDKYDFNLQISWEPDPVDRWTPNDGPIPEALYLDANEGEYLRIEHYFTGQPKTPETYWLDMTFYAQDS